MPHFPLADALTDHSDGTDQPCGPYRALLLSDTGGLTQFGAFVEILPPGSASSIKHWHAAEDEMIHMLSGEVTPQEGDTRVILHPGDTPLPSRRAQPWAIACTTTAQPRRATS